MTPDSPDKQAKEEILDLNDVAEEVLEGDDLGAHDVDASFEQELEDLFSEDLELEEPAVGKIEEASEDEDLLVLDDVVEEVSDDDLMVLDDVIEDGDALVLDDVVEESEEVLELDDFVVDEADDDLLELDDIMEDVGEIDSADSDSDAMLENFDLGEESLMADEGDSADGEVDAEGLDNIIDGLGGDVTVAADDKDDIDNLFDGDTDVAALDQLLEDSGSDDEIDDLDDLLGEVSEDVDLSAIGEDVLADEDIESLLSDEEELVEISEEGLDPLDVVESDAVTEPVEATAEVESTEPVEALVSDEVADVVEIDEVDESAMVVEPVEAEIPEALEIDMTGTLEDSEAAEVSEESEEILDETSASDTLLAAKAVDLDTDMDDSDITGLDSSDDIQLDVDVDDDAIDLSELLKDVEIDLSDLDEDDLINEDESAVAAGPVVTVEAVDELADKIDLFDSELVKLKDLIELTAAGCKDANLEEKADFEEKATLAEKRAEDLEIALAESSERIIALEEKVAQIDSLENTVSSLMSTIQGLEERLSGGEIESAVGQKLSEALRADSPTVNAVAIAAADDMQERVEEWVQVGLREIQSEIGDKITALEEKLAAAPDMGELVSKKLETELDPDSTSFYRIKSRLTEDIEDYLTPRLIEKIEEMKGEVEENFKSTIDEIIAEKLERSVPAEAARIIREEIAALARDFEE